MKNSFLDLEVGDAFSYNFVWDGNIEAVYVGIVKKKTASKLSVNIFYRDEAVDDGSEQYEEDFTLWIKGVKIDQSLVFKEFLWSEKPKNRIDRLKLEFPNTIVI